MGRFKLYLLIAGLLLLVILTAGQSASTRTKLRDTRKALKTSKDMLDASANTDRTVSGTAQRMRDGKF